MNYSNSPGHCRVDRFKSSGKWYDTISLDMNNDGYNDLDLYDHFIKCLQDQHSSWLKESDGYWSIVCLEPYHKNSHPIMIKV